MQVLTLSDDTVTCYFLGICNIMTYPDKLYSQVFAPQNWVVANQKNNRLTITADQFGKTISSLAQLHCVLNSVFDITDDTIVIINICTPLVCAPW